MLRILMLDADYRFLTTFEDHFYDSNKFKILIKTYSSPTYLENLLSRNFFDITILGDLPDKNYNILKVLSTHESTGKIIKIIENVEDTKLIDLIQCGVSSVWVKTRYLQELEDIIHFTNEHNAYIDPKLSLTLVEYIKSDIKDSFSNKILLKSLSLKILNLLKEGYSYDQISKELQVSINVVRYQIKSIYKALDVKNKSAAISKLSIMNVI